MAAWFPNRLTTRYSHRSKKDSTFGDTRYSKSTRIRNVRAGRKSSSSTNWLMALSDRLSPRLLSSMRLFRPIAIWSQTNTLERSSSTSKGCGNALLLVVSSFIWLAPSLRGQFVYVANGGGSNNVSAYKIDLNGSLTAIPGSPFAARNLPSCVGVDPNGKFAYVVNESSGDVSGYKIASGGALIAIPGSPFSVGSDPHQIAIDPAGKFAYVVNAADNNVSAYRIRPDCSLTPIHGSPFIAGRFPRSLVVDPAAKLIYVANEVGNNVSVYRLNLDGCLQPIPRSPFSAGIGPFAVAVGPPARAYSVAKGGARQISAYRIVSGRAAYPISGSPFPPAATRGLVAC